MAEVVLFHSVLGMTSGIGAFADELRSAGHTVHTPDLFDGRTFATVADGVAFTNQTEWSTWIERGVLVASQLPGNAVYAGISFGVASAQRLAMTREDARGALLLESFVSPQFFGEWTPRIPVQIHGKEGDEFFAEDLPAARTFAHANPTTVELYVYEGTEHLFMDRSSPSYDPEIAALVIGHVIDFLNAL
jgi:dienelactone hydrolase